MLLYLLFASSSDEGSKTLEEIFSKLSFINKKIIKVDSKKVRDIISSSTNITLKEIPSLVIIDEENELISIFEGFLKCKQKIDLIMSTKLQVIVPPEIKIEIDNFTVKKTSISDLFSEKELETEVKEEIEEIVVKDEIPLEVNATKKIIEPVKISKIDINDFNAPIKITSKKF